MTSGEASGLLTKAKPVVLLLYLALYKIHNRKQNETPIYLKISRGWNLGNDGHNYKPWTQPSVYVAVCMTEILLLPGNVKN
jgi:hypothetical protein